MWALCWRIGAFFGALLRRADPENRTRSHKSRKNFDTVREALFRRESVRLTMHGWMDNMAIKQHPFWVRPYMVPHFCGTSTCVGLFEESKSRGRGHHGRTGAALDLVVTEKAIIHLRKRCEHLKLLRCQKIVPVQTIPSPEWGSIVLDIHDDDSEQSAYLTVTGLVYCLRLKSSSFECIYDFGVPSLGRHCHSSVPACRGCQGNRTWTI